MSNQIDIPEFLIDDFIERSNSEDLTEGERQAAEQQISHIGDFCKWVTNTLDQQAKGMGYPGTGKVPPDKLGELYGKILERNLSAEMLAKTPEASAVVLTVGIIGVNLAAHRRRKIQEQKDKQESDKDNG